MKEGVPPPKFSEKDIVEFIFFPVVNEGCRVIDEGEAGSAQVGQQGSQLQACVCLAAVPLIAVNCRYAHRPGSHTAHMPATGAEPKTVPSSWPHCLPLRPLAGIVDKPADLDVAMVMGMGFPAFRGGLIFWADLVGAGAPGAGVWAMLWGTGTACRRHAGHYRIRAR